MHNFMTQLIAYINNLLIKHMSFYSIKPPLGIRTWKLKPETEPDKFQVPEHGNPRWKSESKPKTARPNIRGAPNQNCPTATPNWFLLGFTHGVRCVGLHIALSCLESTCVEKFFMGHEVILFPRHAKNGLIGS